MDLYSHLILHSYSECFIEFNHSTNLCKDWCINENNGFRCYLSQGFSIDFFC